MRIDTTKDTERVLQDNVIAELGKLGWEWVYLNNNNDLLNNFRSILESRNKDELNRLGLSGINDKLFAKMVDKIDKLKNSVDSRGLLLDDNIALETSKGTGYFTIFDKVNVSNNIYQVADEVTCVTAKRHDVILLINGLPVVNMELKTKKEPILDASNQVKDYAQQLTSIMKTLQLFVTSN